MSALTSERPPAKAAARKSGKLAATVNQKDLRVAISHAMRAVGKARNTLAILGGLHLKVDRSVLTVSGYDYETSASGQVAAPGATSGEVLIGGATLRSMIALLPAGKDVRLTSNGTRLTISASGPDGVITYEVPTLPAEDYPELPNVEYASGKELIATLTGGQLATLAHSLAAAGGDDTLPVLTGIHLSANGGNLTAAATDRYRLAVHDTEFPTELTSTPLVPARALRHIVDAFKATEAPVTLRLGDAQGGVRMLYAKAGARTFTTRLLDGQFPDYRKLLPKHDLGTRFTVTGQRAILAVRQAAVAAARTSPVLLHLKSAGSSIAAGSTTSDSIYSTVTLPDTKLDGPDCQFACNPGYLIDGLRLFGKDDRVSVAINVQGPDDSEPGTVRKPVLFTSEERPGLTYLLMPVRLA